MENYNKDFIDNHDIYKVREDASLMEQRLKVMLDTLPMLCAIFDEDFNVIEANQYAATLFGLSDKRIYMERLYDLCPEYQPDGSPTKEKAHRMLSKAFDQGNAVFEWMHCTLDKKTMIPCEVSLNRVALGGRNAAVCYVRDMRKQYKINELQETEQEWMQAILDSSPLVCMLFDEKFNCLNVNRKVLELFKVPDKQTYMDDVLAFSPEYQPNGTYSREGCNAALAKTFEIGYMIHEWMCQTYYGELIPCEEILEKVKLGDRYFVISYLRDLREYYRIKKMQETEQQSLQAMLDSSPLVCAIFDREHNSLRVNQKVEALFEIPDKQIYLNDVTKFMPKFQPDGRDSIEKSYEMLRLCFENGHGRYEWMYQTLDGKPLLCEEILERVRLGDRDFVLVYTRDLREEKEMIANLEDSMKREQMANQAKTRFLARMSHEIRTPLNSVLGVSEQQLQKDTHPADTEEAFVRIYNSSHMLLAIINDILDLSKVESGKMEILTATYETASMIIDTVQLNLMFIGSKRIDFKLNVDENLPGYLVGDELRVKQILNNLLSNAFKYTMEGTVTLSFYVESRSDDDVIIVIKVEDTGQGMTKDQVDKLFTAEFTRFNIESNRSIEGSGLGLNISYQLINMMHGDISVESTLGSGSEFIVRLPQKVSGKNVIGQKAASSMQSLEDTQKSLKRLSRLEREPMPYGRVLVVDDVESNLYVAKGFLIPYKLVIETVESGILAIEKVKSGEVYDIIFMDHMMPDMDGVEATKILRDMGYHHPIVALTANAFSDMAEIFMSNGFSGYASKPIDVNQINKYLLRFIRDKQPIEVIEKAREAKLSYAKKDEKILSEALVKSFVGDAKKAAHALENFSEDDINSCIIQIHAMKSALHNIGRKDLSNLAAALEQTARRGDTQAITDAIPNFLIKLNEVIKEFDHSADKKDPVMDSDSEQDLAFLKSQMQDVGSACDDLDIDRAKDALKKLSSRNYSKETVALIDEIRDFLISGDYEQASDLSKRTAEK